MNSEGDKHLRVEVVYAEPARQVLLALNVPRETTASAALELAGLASEFPGVDFSQCELGVWGRPVNAQQVLHDGDRLEVYRPLRMDPREARRQLALHGRAMGQPDSDDG